MYVWTDGTDYLAHHGTKGQKWGVRNYQNPDGTLTALGRARLGLKGTYDGAKHAIKNAKAAIKQARIKAKRAATLKKARKAKEAKAKAEAEEAARKKAEQDEIEKAIASGDPTRIKQYAEKMTTEQIKEANNRIDAMKALSDREANVQKTVSDLAFTKLSDITKKAEQGISFYNTVAKLSNTFLNTDLRPISATLGSIASGAVERDEAKTRKDKADARKADADARKAEAEADKAETEARKAEASAAKAKDGSKKAKDDSSKSDSSKSGSGAASTADSDSGSSSGGSGPSGGGPARGHRGTKWERKPDSKSFVYATYEEVKDEYGSGGGSAGWVTTEYGPLPLGLISSSSSAGMKYLEDPEKFRG